MGWTAVSIGGGLVAAAFDTGSVELSAAAKDSYHLLAARRIPEEMNKIFWFSDIVGLFFRTISFHITRRSKQYGRHQETR